MLPDVRIRFVARVQSDTRETVQFNADSCPLIVQCPLIVKPIALVRTVGETKRMCAFAVFAFVPQTEEYH